MFRESIQKMIDRVDGGVAGILMGYDGIAVESYTRTAEADIQTIGMELAHVVTQVRRAAEHLEIGRVDELMVRAQGLIILLHPLDQEYFVAIAVRPEGNSGKARYLLRLLVPQLRSEL